MSRKKPLMFYVNVYEKGRAYGGPEEGGWWYTVHESLGCEWSTTTKDEAIELAASLRLKIEQPETYRMGINNTDGCDPDGQGDDSYLTLGGVWGHSNVVVYVEDHPPQHRPEERPRYE